MLKDDCLDICKIVYFKMEYLKIFVFIIIIVQFVAKNPLLTFIFILHKKDFIFQTFIIISLIFLMKYHFTILIDFTIL